eukprot:TRINITY_DN18562_c0_g1_i1.p1 TRINITY_DN18562_c0_g1~~TRINITY_DN18562_c0_g1_i1.p1  ORF type:complete len:1064 (+),score=187.97 TRINITY_DN18562_c0_g1_i1:52-3243(+)
MGVQKLVEAGDLLSMGKTREAETIMTEVTRQQGAIMPAAFDVLMNHDNPYAQFFAAEVLKKIVVRDWKTLNTDQRNTLIGFPLTCLETRYNKLQPNTRQYLQQLYASCMKLSWELESHSLGQLVSSMMEKPIGYCNAEESREMGQSLLATIITEFGSTDESHLGIPWKLSELLRESFQHLALPQIITWVWSQMPLLNKPSRHREGYLRLFSEQILSWEYSKRHPDDDIHSDSHILKLDANWREYFLNPITINSLMESLKGETSQSEQCLMQEAIVQMCGVSGKIFQSSNEERSNWLSYLLDAVLMLMESSLSNYSENSGPLLLRSCRGVCKLSRVHNSNLWYSMPSFSKQVTNLSNMTQHISIELGKRPGDTYLLESIDLLLQVWSTNLIDVLDDLYSLTNDIKGTTEQKKILKEACSGIFVSYLSGQVKSPSIDIADEAHEEEFSDNTQSLLAHIGRHVPDVSLGLLDNLLQESLSQLSSGSVGPNYFDVLNVIIKVGTSLITDPNDSEVPLIPILLSDFSRHQEEGIPEDINGVMIFSKLIFILSETLLDISSSQSGFTVSPLVMSTLLKCLSRFVSSYLFPDSANIDVPPVFTAAFQNGEGSRERIITIAHRALAIFAHDITVADCAIKALKSFAVKAEMQKVLSTSQAWTRLAADEAMSGSVIGSRLPMSCRRGLMETLCLGSGDKYQYLLPAIEQAVKTLLDKPEILQSDNEFIFKLQIELERIRGVCLSSIHATERQASVYGWVQGIFPLLVQLASTFHNRKDIVVTLFELLDDLVRAQNSFSSPEHVSVLFDCSLSMIKVYSKHSSAASLKISSARSGEVEEDENVTTLLSVISLLNHIVEWDTLGCFGSNNTGQLGGDVVLIGIHGLLSVISEDFLSHPSLVQGFYRLLDGSLALYSSKILSYPQQLIDKLIYSIHFGLRSPQGDIMRACNRCLKSLCDANRSAQQQAGHVPLDVATMTALMKVTFQLSVFERLPRSAFPDVGGAVFALVRLMGTDTSINVLREVCDNHPYTNNILQSFMECFNAISSSTPKQSESVVFDKSFESFLLTCLAVRM